VDLKQTALPDRRNFRFGEQGSVNGNQRAVTSIEKANIEYSVEGGSK